MKNKTAEIEAAIDLVPEAVARMIEDGIAKLIESEPPPQRRRRRSKAARIDEAA